MEVINKSMEFLRNCNESICIGLMHMFRHFLCTFSSFSMSVFIYGFHAGDAYSSPGRIIVVYKVVIFSGV